MVDQAFKTEDLSTSPDISHHRHKPFIAIRQYSTEDSFKDFTNNLGRTIESEGSSDYNSNIWSKKKDTENVQKSLLNFAFKLLNSSSSETESLTVRRQIKKLESEYKFVMEKFLFKMENFIYSCENLRENMHKTIRNFKFASRLTAGVTLVSSAIEVSLLVGSSLQKIFDFAWNSKISLIETLGGSVGVAAALCALSYMRWSAAEISKEVRDEKKFLMDLVVLHRKGNWIDEEVLNLFPYGINLKMLDESDLNNHMPLQTKKSWRHDLCYAILLTNSQKDVKLLRDEQFLTKVKMFVRSQAAEVWWNRRKIKKLLENILKKLETTSVNDITADQDIHFKKIALYLYPVMIPLLLNSWNSGRTKFLCSSLLFILSLNDLTGKESEDAEELKKVINNFEKDFKEIQEICQSLDSEDEN